MTNKITSLANPLASPDSASVTVSTIETLCHRLGIPTVGIAPWPLPADAKEHLFTNEPCPFTAGTLEERLQGGTHLATPRSAIVCLFPYYMNTPAKTTSNIARYAWADDYHLVVTDYLSRLIDQLRLIAPEAEFEIHCDTSPLADRYMAYLAGLGFYGKNRALINPTWGTYTNIGSILTTLPLEPATPMTRSCLGCNACIRHCPGQSLGDKDFHFHTCKSYVTQKKGDLTDDEKSIIRKTPLIWGCDVCQEVCPHNRGIPETPIPEFRRIQARLDVSEVAPLSNREFKNAFGHRAFAWRGKKVLLRNQEILDT